VNIIGTDMRVSRGHFHAIGTDPARTRHRFAGIVLGEGGGTTPRPWEGDPRRALAAAAVGGPA